MEEDKKRLLEYYKTSLEDFKKKEFKDKSCRSADFQPLLEFSSWHCFDGILERILELYKQSSHYLEHCFSEGHMVTLLEAFGNSTEALIYEKALQSQRDLAGKPLAAKLDQSFPAYDKFIKIKGEDAPSYVALYKKDGCEICRRSSL